MTKGKANSYLYLYQILVDITETKNVKLYDEVVVIGKQGSEEVPASSWATLMGGISSHLTQRTLLSRRLPRIYLYKGKKVALKFDLKSDMNEILNPEVIN